MGHNRPKFRVLQCTSLKKVHHCQSWRCRLIISYDSNNLLKKCFFDFFRLVKCTLYPSLCGLWSVTKGWPSCLTVCTTHFLNCQKYNIQKQKLQIYSRKYNFFLPNYKIAQLSEGVPLPRPHFLNCQNQPT